MENASSSPSTNIVATAMSKANVISPDSPQVVPKSHVQDIGQQISQRTSESPRPRSANMPNSDQMEVGDSPPPPPTRSLIKQASQDCDSPAPRPMETAPPPGNFKTEDHEKTRVLLNEPRNDGKEPHLVTITPPTTLHQQVNGDTRPQGLYMYNHERVDQPMIPASHMHLLPKDYKTDAHTELEKPNEDTTYAITCGNDKAELVWKKFICPGINAKCVKRAGQWLTPKEFVSCAGKQTLKDWKRAIRINGTMLRKLIESGELNYYDHENNCSNQCRSNKNSSFDSTEKPYNSFENDPREMLNYRVPSQPSGEGLLPKSNSEDLPYLQKRPGLQKSQESNTSLSITGSLERSSSEDSGLAPSPHVDSIIMKEAFASTEKLQDLQNFWNGIIRSELFDDIVRDVLTHISNLHAKTKVTNVVSVEDAGTLTNLVNSLEMIPSITQRLSLYKHSMEEQAEKSTREIQELEKKLAEQKKFELDLKRKSQHLDSVMPLIPNEKRQKRTMLRFVRQKAVDSRIPPGVIPGTSSSPVPASRMSEVMMPSRVPNRELWPQALQATSTQLSRLNVSGCVASALPGIAPMFLTHANIHTPPEGFPPSSLSQAFMASQQAAHQHSPRDTQSPSKK